jgi:hypothetical protein
MVRHTGEDFIDVEGVAVASVLAFQPSGINGSELDAPQADRFSGYSDTSLGKEIFNVTVAEVESVVKPDGVTDYVGREPVTFICIHPSILPIHSR